MGWIGTLAALGGLVSIAGAYSASISTDQTAPLVHAFIIGGVCFVSLCIVMAFWLARHR
jgi:hypothetical protein